MLRVKISSPDGIIWEGKAESITSENTQGIFDILPEHANFITIIKDKPIVVDTGEDKKEYNYETAIILTRENNVSIYTHL